MNQSELNELLNDLYTYKISHIKNRIKLLSFDAYKSVIDSVSQKSNHYTPLQLYIMMNNALENNDVKKIQLFDLSILTYLHKKLINLRHRNGLTSVMKSVFSHYLEGINDAGVRIAINKLILDYIDVCKPSVFLIKNLIECKMFSLLSYVNVLTPLVNFNLGELNDLTKRELERYGIVINNSMRILKYGTLEEFLNVENNYYENGRLKPSLIKKIPNTTVLKYLCDNDKIDVSRKAIKYYHSQAYVKLLIQLIKSKKIKITKADVVRLFSKRKTKQNRRVKRYHNIRRVTMEFKNNIVEYVKLIKDFEFPINKLIIKNTFFANRMYTQLVDIISDSKVVSTFISREKRKLFNHIVTLDDLDRFKILLNKKIFSIEELHQKSTHIKQCFNLSPNTWKIAKYMISTLNIRTNYFHNWFLRTTSSDELLKVFNLIKDSNAPLDNNLLTSVIRYKKSTEVIDFLINECGMKITNKHIVLLTYYPLKHFKKYTQGLKFNKNSTIRKCINDAKRSNYYHGDILCSNIHVILYLMSLNKYCIKYCIKYCTMALLTGKTRLYEAIKKKFNVEADLTVVKTVFDTGFALKPYKCYSDGLEILLSITKGETEQSIKSIVSNFDAYNLIMFINSKYTYVSNKKYNIEQFKNILEHLTVKCSYEQLQGIIFGFGYTFDTGETDTFFKAVLLFFEKAMRSVSDDDMKKMVNFLCERRVYSCLTVCTPNLHRYITLENVYKLLLENNACCSKNHAVINSISYNYVKLTPLVYDVLFLCMCEGLRYVNVSIDEKIIDTLTTPPITQKTYDAFNNLDKHCKKYDMRNYSKYKYIFERIKTREIVNYQQPDAHFDKYHKLKFLIHNKKENWKTLFTKPGDEISDDYDNLYNLYDLDDLDNQSEDSTDLDDNIDIDELINDALNEAVMDNDCEYKQIIQRSN